MGKREKMAAKIRRLARKGLTRKEICSVTGLSRSQLRDITFYSGIHIKQERQREFLAVSDDEFERVITSAATVPDLAKRLGKSPAALYRSLGGGGSFYCRGFGCGKIKVVRVELDAENGKRS